MKGHFWKRTVAGCLALLLVSGSVPAQPVADLFDTPAIMASAAEAVTYIDWNGEVQTCTDYTVLTGNETGTLAPCWYLVDSNITYTSTLTFDPGDVHIILADGCTMNIGTEQNNVSGYGISNWSSSWTGGTTIHSQSNGTGTLNIYSTNYCIRTRTGFAQLGGILNLVSSDDCVYSDGNFDIKGGTLNADSSDYAVHCGGAINIDGG